MLGCSNIHLTNTSNLYARFTTTVICNAIIQNSREPCNLASDALTPVCANTCVCNSCIMCVSILTMNRPNKRRVKQSLLLIVHCVQIPEAMLMNRSEPTLPIARCPPIHCQVHALMVLRMSPIIAALEIAPLAFASTVVQEVRTVQTLAVITRVQKRDVPALCCLR